MYPQLTVTSIFGCIGRLDMQREPITKLCPCCVCTRALMLQLIFGKILSNHHFFHTYEENIVLFAFGFFRVCICVKYLDLNVSPAKPMYFLIGFVMVVTSAWYTSGPTLQSPFKGHSVFILQLQGLAYSFCLLLFNIVLLCLAMCLSTFLVVE